MPSAIQIIFEIYFSIDILSIDASKKDELPLTRKLCYFSRKEYMKELNYFIVTDEMKSQRVIFLYQK